MGLKSQLGLAVESTYGTYVAPTRFLEFVSETLSRENRTIDSEGLRGAGRSLRRGTRRNLVGRSAAGNVRAEVGPDGFGLLFEHMLGAVSTTNPGTLAYEHEFTIGSLTDKYLTIQKGVEADDETVAALSYLGCKVADWAIEIGIDEFVMLDLGLDARDEDTAESLAVASYTEGNLFSFEGCTASIDSTPIATATRLRINGTNPMKNDKYYLGNAGLKANPTTEGYPTITGEVTLRFNGIDALYAAFQADTAVELEFDALTGEEVEAGQAEQLTITLPDIRLTGSSPEVSGPQVPELSVPFVAYEPAGGGEPITVLLRNGDATP